MRKVYQNSQAVHFRNGIATESRYAAVALFKATRRYKILGVIGELHDFHTKLSIDLQEVDIIIDARSILPTQNYPDQPLTGGRVDIFDAFHLHDEVCVLIEHPLPMSNCFHCVLEALPNTARAVCDGDAALFHFFKNAPIKITD